MTNTNKLPVKETFNPFAGLSCKLFGHKYRIIRRYKSNLREFECAHCKKQFTLDGYGHYTPLTPKLKKANEVYHNYINTKRLVG